jgi:long-subunit acyl-CoA synthetase (AMP-forming)
LFPVKIYLISTNSFFNFVSRYFQVECVRKFIVLPKEFSIPGGELGPTLKLKRYLVAEMYQKEIDEMYK